MAGNGQNQWLSVLFVHPAFPLANWCNFLSRITNVLNRSLCRVSQDRTLVASTVGTEHLVEARKMEPWMVWEAAGKAAVI